MKRKIIIGLGIYTFVFLLAGLYILKVVNETTAKLDNLITLHKVEILREHYLVQIRRVQTDLSLTGTRFSKDFDTVVDHGRKMGKVVGACSGCHHDEPVATRLTDLQNRTEVYTDALSRVLTIQASNSRMAEEEDRAFQVGETLIDEVNQMIAITGPRLEVMTEKALSEIDRSKYALYFLVAIGPFMSAVLGFIFARGITNPLGILLESTRKLKTGKLDHRVEVLKDEFGELGDAFNEMAASLTEQMTKMQRAEQMAVVGELSAGLAHEIKNPLAGIKVAMHVLAEEAELPEEDRSVLVKVGEEVTRLESLMKGFLNFARPPRPQPTKVDLDNLLNNTLTFYGKTSKNGSGIEMVKQLGNPPPVLIDPMQLQQVLLNLLINAADAMPNGGTLTVTSSSEEETGTARIDVSDTGVGIREADADKIFHPFFTTKVGGTGLGLATSRQLLEQQGGAIEMGAAPGGGTVFTIRLPLRTAVEEQER